MGIRLGRLHLFASERARPNAVWSQVRCLAAWLLGSVGGLGFGLGAFLVGCIRCRVLACELSCGWRKCLEMG